MERNLSTRVLQVSEVIMFMWKKIRTKYLHTLLSTAIAGIWGLLMGKDDWTTLLVDVRAIVTIAICASFIVFGALVVIVVWAQKRKEEDEVLDRAHGKQ